ncbi:hypothetical protein [Azospirillum melinis]
MPRPVRVCCGHRHIPTAGPARGRYCTHARACCQRFGSWSEAGFQAAGISAKPCAINRLHTECRSGPVGAKTRLQRCESPPGNWPSGARPPIRALGLTNGDRPRPQGFRGTCKGVSRPAKETLSPDNGLPAGTRVARL